MLGGQLFVRHLISPFVAPGTNASARAAPELRLHKSHTWEPTSAVRRSVGPGHLLGPIAANRAEHSQSIDRVLVNRTNRNGRKGQDNAEHAAGSAGGKEVNDPCGRRKPLLFARCEHLPPKNASHQ